MKITRKIFGTAALIALAMNSAPPTQRNVTKTMQTLRFAQRSCLAGMFLILALASGSAQPTITIQPSDQTAIVGGTAMFTMSATGLEPLVYQWRRYTNSTSFGNLPSETNTVLLLTNVQPTAHRFAVVVSDTSGSSTSRLAKLNEPARITTQPASQLAEVGGALTFIAAATGTIPLNYQWRLNDTNLAGKTSTNLVLSNVQLTSAGGYTVVVTNIAGAATSHVAVLTLLPAVFTKITTGAIVNDGGFSWTGAWGDYNNDGWPDLFAGNSNSDQSPDGPNAESFLYRNNGDGTFMRVTNVSVVTNRIWSISGVWGDYDNDGFLDLFVSNPNHPNSLYRNLGDGTFSKITNGLMATEEQYSHAAAWADFDRDGFLDVFIANFRQTPSSPFRTNFLYRNLGDGTFSKISFGPKPANNGDSWNVAWADYDNDGWPDLFVPFGGTRSRQNSFLHHNNGDGTFSRVTNGVIATEIANSVACAWGDYDNDGFLDLFVSNFYDQNNFLYHNNGDGTFTKVTNCVVALDHGTSVGCAWGDYDNDGWLDLFVANLGPVDTNSFASIREENNFLYHNNGNGSFTKITSGILVNDLGYSTGCAWADYDNDGFLDLFVANGWGTQSQNNFLYHNSGNSNAWLTLKLIGTVSNRSAIGAKVHVMATVSGKTFWQMREISGGSNYGSQNDLRPIFGLGDATNADVIRIEWPSGIVQTFTNLTARQFLTITEPSRLSAATVGGQPQLALKGGRNMTYDIQTSTNFSNWAPGSTVTITNLDGATPIVVPLPPTGPQKFYRAVLR